MPGNDEYTKLLIHSNTTDGSTTFVDSSVGGSTHTITANGDVHHETDQAKFGASSIQFDGTGDFFSIPSSSDFAFGTENFTIDFWVYENAGVAVTLFDNRDNAATAEGFAIGITTYSAVTFYSDGGFRLCRR